MTEPPQVTLLPTLGPGWIWNNQAPPPSSGQVRTNSRDWTGATLLSIDRRSDDGVDASAAIELLKGGDELRFEHQSDSSRWARYDVLAQGTRTVDHYQIPVAYHTGGGTLPNSGTRILVSTFPAAGPAGDSVAVTFTQTAPMVWAGEARCKHGAVKNTTYVAVNASPTLNYAQMVASAQRQHDQIIACNCAYEAPKLNATVTYGAQPNVAPGERRIILEQSAVIAPAGTNNFAYYGRIVCKRPGAYYIDLTLKLSRGVADGARGMGQVFIAGTPAMLTANMQDIGGIATAIVQGTLNLVANQPLAVGYVNTGTSNESVQATTLRASEVWVP